MGSLTHGIIHLSTGLDYNSIVTFWKLQNLLLIETAKSLAKEQYAIYNTGSPKLNSLFGIHSQHPKQETSYTAN